MKSLNLLVRLAPKTIAAVICLATFNSAVAGTLDPTIDDFSDPDYNSLGIERQFVNDTVSGGKTSMKHGFEEGIFSAKGEISPPRGQPGWASTVLLLENQGLPRDASAYEGIRLLVRVNKGNLSITANSSEVTNFDFHAAPVTRHSDGEFHEVMIPFAKMKRAWSEQTKLNTKTLTSLSIVAFDIQQGSFDFEIDEVSFY
jgi:hypothetical protein